jgi:hypothetical protein
MMLDLDFAKIGFREGSGKDKIFNLFITTMENCSQMGHTFI